jgi:hypothetical protein
MLYKKYILDYFAETYVLYTLMLELSVKILRKFGNPSSKRFN